MLGVDVLNVKMTLKEILLMRQRCQNVMYMHGFPLGNVVDLYRILPSCNMLLWNQSV